VTELERQVASASGDRRRRLFEGATAGAARLFGVPLGPSQSCHCLTGPLSALYLGLEMNLRPPCAPWSTDKGRLCRFFALKKNGREGSAEQNVEEKCQAKFEVTIK